MGLPDPPDGLTDYGPEAQEARADLARDLLNAVAKETPTNDRDRVAVESIQDRHDVLKLDVFTVIRDDRVLPSMIRKMIGFTTMQ